MKAISQVHRSDSAGRNIGRREGARRPGTPSGAVLVAACLLTLAGLGRPALAQVQQPCGVSALCLGEGRYQLLVFWTDPESGNQNVAHPVLLTPDSGYFWFFGPTNIEITAKAVDGCSMNGHEWVFISGMTNVSTRIEVMDVQTATHKTYTNAQGTAFAPIQDTGTFSSCPGASGGPIDGEWTGTFDSADFVDCDSGTPAQASLSQDGDSVTGTLSASPNFCGPNHARLAGTLHGDTLTGVVTGADYGGGGYRDAHVFGTLTGTSLELVIVNGFGLIPGGTLHLHR
ncbi:MAG TPA: hypothetical protein VMH79_15490 [Thermoanaerobaculia bacterium]|nr:hypothetical protein [Thermoanaerobaculia bacterium]